SEIPNRIQSSTNRSSTVSSVVAVSFGFMPASSAARGHGETRRNVVFGDDANGYHGGMLNKRKAAIGYATYVVGTRVAKRAVRRKANAMMRTARERSRPARRRRMIPL